MEGSGGAVEAIGVAEGSGAAVEASWCKDMGIAEG